MHAELIARLEKADKGQSSLDEAVARGLGWTCRQVGGVFAWFSPEAPDHMRAEPPRVTRSLNEAFADVERIGWRVHGLDASVPGRFAWTLCRPCPIPNDGMDCVMAVGNAPALALCIATLRALGEVQ